MAFSDLSEYETVYTVSAGEETYITDKLELSVPAGSEREFTLKLDLPGNIAERIFIRFEVVSKERTAWCAKGHLFASSQLELPFCSDRGLLSDSGRQETTAPIQRADVKEEKRYIYFTSGEKTYCVDKAYGSICSIRRDGKELLAAPTQIVTWRALIDNDVYRRERWISEHFHKAYFNVLDVTLSVKKSSVEFSGTYGADSRAPIFTMTIRYSFDDRGVKVDIHAKRNPELRSFNRSSSEETDLDLNLKTEIDSVPRFGVRFVLKEGFETFRYFGRGPKENYCDFQGHADLGVWNSTVTEEYVPYIRPQECGNHTGCDWLEIADRENTLKLYGDKPFEFSALHYSIEQLDRADHSFEIAPLKETHLLVNYRVEGVGSNSCGPALEDKYKVNDRVIDFSFALDV